MSTGCGGRAAGGSAGGGAIGAATEAIAVSNDVQVVDVVVLLRRPA